MPGNLTTTTSQVLQLTTSLQQQIGTTLSNDIYNQKYSLGEHVQNVGILPYVKSTTILFDAYGMKPNTKLYAYFGNIPVSNYCAMRYWNPLEDPNIDSTQFQVSSSGSLNPDSKVMTTTLVSDQYGSCKGIFTIPPNTFKSQEISFRLTDISNLEQGEDAVTTNAESTYYGSRLQVSIGETILNTRQARTSSIESANVKRVTDLGLREIVTQQYVEDPTYMYVGGGCGCGYVVTIPHPELNWTKNISDVVLAPTELPINVF